MWNNFLEDMHIKDEFGITQLMATSQLISRKISGLPVKENFMELHKKVKIDLFSSISYCENILNSVDLSHYGELGKTYKIFMLNQINQLKEKSQTFKPQKISNEQQLGPQAFRAIPKLKALELKIWKQIVWLIKLTNYLSKKIIIPLWNNILKKHLLMISFELII